MTAEIPTLIHAFQAAFEAANGEPAPRVSRDGNDYIIHDDRIGWNNRRRREDLIRMTARLRIYARQKS